MPVVKSQVARKDYKCRHGCEIHKGERYYRAKKKFQKPRFGCLQHPFKGSELATSGKVASLLGIKEDLAGLSFNEENVESIADSLDDAASRAREVGEEYEESANNMEEYFPSSSQVDDIREKAENCESWADALENAAGEVRDLVGEIQELKTKKDKLQEQEHNMVQAGEDTEKIGNQINDLETQIQAKLDEVSDKVSEASDEMMC